MPLDNCSANVCTFALTAANLPVRNCIGRPDIFLVRLATKPVSGRFQNENLGQIVLASLFSSLVRREHSGWHDVNIRSVYIDHFSIDVNKGRFEKILRDFHIAVVSLKESDGGFRSAMKQ